MPISGVIPQLRTTDLAASIRFYTTQLGLTLDFQYEDFYAGIRVGSQLFHLKLVDQRDPSIEFVEEGEHFHLYFDTTDVNATASALKHNGVHFVTDVHETPWAQGNLRSKMIKATPCTSARLPRLFNPCVAADALKPRLNASVKPMN